MGTRTILPCSPAASHSEYCKQHVTVYSPFTIRANIFHSVSGENMGQLCGTVSINKGASWLPYHVDCIVNHNREKNMCKPPY